MNCGWGWGGGGGGSGWFMGCQVLIPTDKHLVVCDPNLTRKVSTVTLRRVYTHCKHVKRGSHFLPFTRKNCLHNNYTIMYITELG